MRLTIKELYELDPKEFIGVPHEVVLERKIDALLTKKKKLSDELHSIDINQSDSYEMVAPINSEIKYLDRAIQANLADIGEMGIKYKPKDIK